MSMMETTVLKELLAALRSHPRVIWAARFNSGAANISGRHIKFGFDGCPDILGMLQGGQLLAVEAKAERGRLSPAQQEFLERVRAGGGLAAVVHNVEELLRAIEKETTHVQGGIR